MQDVWPDTAVSRRTTSTEHLRLRRALESRIGPRSSRPSGVGYRFVVHVTRVGPSAGTPPAALARTPRQEILLLHDRRPDAPRHAAVGWDRRW
jgi:hypothetical protein